MRACVCLPLSLKPKNQSEKRKNTQVSRPTTFTVPTLPPSLTSPVVCADVKHHARDERGKTPWPSLKLTKTTKCSWVPSLPRCHLKQNNKRISVPHQCHNLALNTNDQEHYETVEGNDQQQYDNVTTEVWAVERGRGGGGRATDFFFFFF